MRKRYIALISTVSLALAACGPVENQKSTKASEAEKSEAAANSIQFSENAERENIVARLKLTSNPGQIGYIALMSMGRPVAYYGVKGKITSGSKRLTSPQEVRCLEVAESVGCSQQMVESASDEGTYGSSNPYIFFWTTGGQYVQWNGEYVYSDQPFRLTTPPLIQIGG